MRKQIFFKTLLVLLLAFSFLIVLFPAISVERVGKDAPAPPLHTEEVSITIPGLQKEYKLLFLSDLHIIVKNDEITPESLETVRQRTEMFKTPDGIASPLLWEQISPILDSFNADAILLGGDMMDYSSTTNIDCLRQGLERLQTPVMYVRADHDYDFTTYCNIEDGRTKQMHQAIDGDHEIFFKELDEILLLGVNNNTSNISAEALENIKEVFAMGKPIILLTHVPLNSALDTSLAEQSKAAWQDRALVWGQDCTYVPDEITKEFLEMVYAENSPVKQVLSGHLHFSWDGALTRSVNEHVFAPAFQGNIGVVTVKGR